MVNFEEGTLIKGAYVVVNGEELPVHMPEYSGNTPMSPENLNKMQTDMEKILKGTILYEDETGTTGAIILSSAIENFAEIEVKSYVVYNEVKVHTTTGKVPVSNRMHLNNQFIGTGCQFRTYSKRIDMSGTDITANSDRYFNVLPSGGIIAGEEGEYTYITEVIGYKN